ncbi:hypothetical protein ACTXT7_016106 [Hymenolepis weldensis]
MNHLDNGAREDMNAGVLSNEADMTDRGMSHKGKKTKNEPILLTTSNEKASQNRNSSGIYSRFVPLEQSLLSFAASEPGTTGVGTVLVINTGGAIGMHKVDGVYRPKKHFLTKYLMQMPIFNDLK